MAAQALGVATSEYIFVDDNLGAVRTAKGAGVVTYGIYDPSSEEYETEIRKCTDAYLRTLTDLL